MCFVSKFSKAKTCLCIHLPRLKLFLSSQKFATIGPKFALSIIESVCSSFSPRLCSFQNSNSTTINCLKVKIELPTSPKCTLESNKSEMDHRTPNWPSWEEGPERYASGTRWVSIFWVSRSVSLGFNQRLIVWSKWVSRFSRTFLSLGRNWSQRGWQSTTNEHKTRYLIEVKTPIFKRN